MYVEGQDGDEEARCPGCRLGGELSRYPKRPGPAGGPEARRRSGFGCNSATRPARGTAGPATPARSGLLGLIFSPTPRQRPQALRQPQRAPERPLGGGTGSATRGSSLHRRDREGRAKKGKGRHFHGREDQIWGGERTGKTRKFKGAPSPTVADFPCLLRTKRKETLLFPP